MQQEQYPSYTDLIKAAQSPPLSAVEIMKMWFGSDLFYAKALSVYNACLQNNKQAIASRIKERYGSRFPSDEYAKAIEDTLRSYQLTTKPV